MRGPTQAEADRHNGHGGYDNYDPECPSCKVLRSLVIQGRLLLLVGATVIGFTVFGLGRAVGWW